MLFSCDCVSSNSNLPKQRKNSQSILISWSICILVKTAHFSSVNSDCFTHQAVLYLVQDLYFIVIFHTKCVAGTSSNSEVKERSLKLVLNKHFSQGCISNLDPFRPWLQTLSSSLWKLGHMLKVNIFNFYPHQFPYNSLWIHSNEASCGVLWVAGGLLFSAVSCWLPS